MKTMVSLTFFKKLLFEGRSVLGLAQRVAESERANCGVNVSFILNPVKSADDTIAFFFKGAMKL